MLQITHFIHKIFDDHETHELNLIDNILQNIKAALIYKGLDFSIVFAENTNDISKKSSKKSQNEIQILQEETAKEVIDLT